MLEVKHARKSRMPSNHVFRSYSHCCRLQATLQARHKEVLQHWRFRDDSTRLLFPEPTTGKFSTPLLLHNTPTDMFNLACSLQLFWQINLSYSAVTEAGLLTLANIGCLQSLTLLHLDGLTPNGLATALLTCEGLTKVKLQESFKSSLPQPLLKHLEARGCVFQWRDKVLEVRYHLISQGPECHYFSSTKVKLKKCMAVEFVG